MTTKKKVGRQKLAPADARDISLPALNRLAREQPEIFITGSGKHPDEEMTLWHNDHWVTIPRRKKPILHQSPGVFIGKSEQDKAQESVAGIPGVRLIFHRYTRALTYVIAIERITEPSNAAEQPGHRKAMAFLPSS